MEIFLKQGVATTIVFPLLQASSATRKTTATLAVGDFKIARHTGGVWNIGNTNTTTPTELTGLGLYALPLTATELTPDDQQYPVIIACHDAAGAEWDDQAIIIRVFDRDIEDLAFPTVSGNSLDVSATGEVGIDLTNIKPAAVPTTLTNITIPTVTTLTNVPANFTALSIDASGRVTLVPSQIIVKKNVALSKFMFVMNSSTTHNPTTGLTVTARRSIDGAAFAAAANAVVEVSNGWYYLDMAAVDLNGTVIAWRMTATGADDCDFTIVTQP